MHLQYRDIGILKLKTNLSQKKLNAIKLCERTRVNNTTLRYI